MEARASPFIEARVEGDSFSRRSLRGWEEVVVAGTVSFTTKITGVTSLLVELATSSVVAFTTISSSLVLVAMSREGIGMPTISSGTSGVDDAFTVVEAKPMNGKMSPNGSMVSIVSALNVVLRKRRPSGKLGTVDVASVSLRVKR